MEVTAITEKVDIAWTIQESEGALMIIEHSAVFGCLGIIIFQLTEWIAIIKMSDSTDSVLVNDMLGFSHLEIPTRHEVPRVPYLHEKNMIEKINP